MPTLYCATYQGVDHITGRLIGLYETIEASDEATAAVTAANRLHEISNRGFMGYQLHQGACPNYAATAYVGHVKVFPTPSEYKQGQTWRCSDDFPDLSGWVEFRASDSSDDPMFSLGYNAPFFPDGMAAQDESSGFRMNVPENSHNIYVGAIRRTTTPFFLHAFSLGSQFAPPTKLPTGFQPIPREAT